MNKPMTKNDQMNVYPLFGGGEADPCGWAAEVMLYPGEECSYQDREWLLLGYFSTKSDALKAARKAVKN